jgi:predicted secreted protein
VNEIPGQLQVPDHQRRVKLPRSQWVGVGLIMLVPVLALFEVFGESAAEAEGTSAELAIRVQYPTRFRYKQLNTVQVLVRNVSGAPIDTVFVSFDSTYASRFSTVTFIPAAQEPFVVELTDVRPGSTRLVHAELQAEQYGRHHGAIKAYRTGSADTARVPLRTIIFP